jgi:hypothetical protein
VIVCGELVLGFRVVQLEPVPGGQGESINSLGQYVLLWDDSD